MKWLTREYIREQALLSRLAAVEVSMEHWLQLATATYEELREGFASEAVGVTGHYCGLCVRCRKFCAICPLHSSESRICCLEYSAAMRFIRRSRVSANIPKCRWGKHKKFQEAAHKLAARLKEIRDECH